MRTQPIASSEVSLRLRLAQRAFAALIENAGTDAGVFHAAQLRGTARRTLSALSADDRERFSRWLVVQLATGAARSVASMHALARADALLAAAVRAALPRTREVLHLPADATAA